MKKIILFTLINIVSFTSYIYSSEITIEHLLLLKSFERIMFTDNKEQELPKEVYAQVKEPKAKSNFKNNRSRNPKTFGYSNTRPNKH